MFLGLLPESEQVIKKRFNVLDVINLIDYDSDPLLLFNKLYELRKDVYQPNDRIVILHYDTDFYVDSRSTMPGLTISNLQMILSKLNIPNCFVLLITSYQNISEELKNAQRLFSNDSVPIPHVICFLQKLLIDPSKVKPVNVNTDLVNKKFCCLNNTNRSHRKKILQLIKHYNLLNDGIISYYNLSAPDFQSSMPSNQNLKISLDESELFFLTTQPYSRINEQWNCAVIDDLTNNVEVETMVLDNLPNIGDSRYQFLEIQKSFLYLVTETVFDYPHPFLTEKLYKGFTAKRPVIVVGAPGSLKTLHNLGYKTFSDYWDESYDNITDPTERMLKLFDQVRFICQHSIKDLQVMLNDMQNILDYNFNVYMDSTKTQTLKLYKDIKQI